MEKLPFITVEQSQWPVIVVTFNREVREDLSQEEKDLKEWLAHFNKLVVEAQEKGSRFIGIYDHTHFQYPSGQFRIKTMNYIKLNSEVLKKSYIQFIMIMPSMITRMALNAALAIAGFPVPVKIVSTMEEARNEAKKHVHQTAEKVI